MSTDQAVDVPQRVWLERARQVFPGGVLGMTRNSVEVSVVASHGIGSKLYDVEGREYLDCRIASGPLMLGHCHPVVVAAVEKQLRQGSTFFLLNRPAIELAELIVSAVPCAEQIRFCASGAEACFYALRLARAYTGRRKVLKFEGGYHGTHDEFMMSVVPVAPPPFPSPLPDSDGIPEATRGLTLVAPFNDIDTATTMIKEHRDELAAVILEPFQRTISPKPGFLEALRKVTRDCGVVLVFDEVITGFRFAWGGAQEFYGVIPDIACYGKIIGGGYHQAAVCGRKELLEAFDPARKGKQTFAVQSGTLNGNPIAAAAGLATLRFLEEGRPELYRRLFQYGSRVRDQLRSALQANGVVGQVLGEGPMFALHMTEQEVTDYRSALSGDKVKEKAFVDGLLRNGVIMASGKGYASVVHDEADFEWLTRAFHAAVQCCRPD